MNAELRGEKPIMTYSGLAQERADSVKASRTATEQQPTQAIFTGQWTPLS